jgi:glycosyltransferase involved in cell wall biosynthesis
VAFHDLPRRFSSWQIHTKVPDSSFTVAFRPSQPWHLQELVDLHRVSILSACLLLDTIAWDVAYCAPPYLEGVWQFLATYADGLLYDSEFTRRRFLTRFPAGANLPGAVTHFSFDPSDYVESTSRGVDAKGEGHILIVGNHLDHKDVRQTTRTLATAFPYRRIKVLGPTDIVSPLVSAVPSGALATSEIDQLYAAAACVVYPSFYEGFGFPILKALAYGRTVFVRRSALVDELAPLCHGGGRLVPFDRREDLVDLVGRLSEGRLRDGMMIGSGRRGASPRGWQDVASDTDRFLTSLIDDRSPTRWQARDRAVRQLISYRS